MSFPSLLQAWRCAALIAFIILFVACSVSGKQPAPLEGKQVPYTRIILLNGQSAPLAHYINNHRYTVVVFWATWCSYSRRLLPKISAWQSLQSNAHVAVVAVSVDGAGKEEKVSQVIRELTLQGMVHAYSGNAEYDEAFMALGSAEIPHFVVINAEGVVERVGNAVGDLEGLE